MRRFVAPPTLTCRLDRRHPLARGLVGWWKTLPDARGSLWYDRSGFGGHGTLMNMTPASWTTHGGQRSSLAFAAASSQYVNVADADRYTFSAWDNSNQVWVDRPFSICAWVRMADATNFPILVKGSDGSNLEWGLITDATDKIRFTCYDQDGGHQRRVIANAVCTADENTWVWFCGTYNGLANGLTIYRNGSPIAVTYAQGTYQGMRNLAVPVTIGASIPGDATYKTFANGQLDDVRIYSRALSAKDAWDLYLDSLTGRYALLLRPRERLERIQSYYEPPTPSGTSIPWPLWSRGAV